MIHLEHSAILSTFIRLPLVIKFFVFFIIEWPFYTGFTVYPDETRCLSYFFILCLFLASYDISFFVFMLNMFMKVVCECLI